ncbi:MAG: AmmeMemoRadiSam system protein B [Candidatus Pacebacteria bacterium]|nr:AmmeMemoRadiSam system protein B [Candidatus Paceibacterota bacterium]
MGWNYLAYRMIDRMHGIHKHIVVAFTVLFLCIFFSGYLLLTRGVVEHPDPETSTMKDVTRHRSYSSDPLLYAITSTSTYQQKYIDTIFGGIVSHHLLANIDISNFFAEFTDQIIDRVIILGPNHYYPNDPPFLSTTRDYTTSFGDVRVDGETITSLVENGLVKISPNILEEEHSISSLVPYVAAYFPTARIVPIIVSAHASKNELQILSDFLVQNTLSNTIVVASVDFSHHLYSNAAQVHDTRSIVAIQNFDYDALFKLEVDSPSSLFILLRYLEAKGAKDVSVQQQSSANIFNTYDSEDVTSYVFAHARKGEGVSSSGVSALFFGDTMLGRGIAKKNTLFTNIRGPEGNFLKGYDAIMLNLEGAVARKNCDIKNDELVVSPNDLSLLTQHHVTHVGIMNNHFGLCQYDLQMKNIFDEKKLIPIDDSGVMIDGTNIEMEVISFFASPVPTDISAMVDRVKGMAVTDRAVVVNIHWGVEYNIKPSTQEKELARALIDAGADVIIGHHPHVVQPVEVYKNGLIVYSLGNFISDQIGQQTKDGFAVGLFVTTEYIRATIFPFTQQGGAPVHFQQSRSRVFCENMFEGEELLQSKSHPCIITVPR